MLKKVFSSSLVKNASVYGGTSIVNAAIPFLIMPILTRYMVPADYGLVSIFTVLVTLFSPLIGISTQGAIARQYFNRDKVDMSVYITSCFLILLVSFAAVALIVFLFSGLVGRLSEFPSEWLWTVLLVSFCNFIISVVTTMWQVQSKPLYYGQFQIGQTILNVALSLWLVVALQHTWKGRIHAQVVTATIFAMIGMLVLIRKKWVSFVVKKTYVQHALRFGLPLIPHTIGAVVMTMSDRLFITNMVGLNETGLYSVGYAFGSIIGFIENAFNLAYAPWLFEQLNKDDEMVKQRIVKLTYAYFVIIIGFAVLLSVIGPWFFSFFVGEKFINSKVFVIWIALGFAFGGMYKMVVNYLFYVEKTKVLAWITLSSAILNLPLNYFFIKAFGAIGAAMATTTVSALFFIFTWILSSRYYKMPWSFKTILSGIKRTNDA
jgi:O-antigen/teichoic acid export membrane protein